MTRIATELIGEQYLTGQLLIATPQIQDPRFTHTVILVCGHDHSGAMGIIINRRIESLSFQELAARLEIPIRETPPVYVPIHFGGPIEMGRGFIVHSESAACDPSVKIAKDLFLSSTVDALAFLATGEGPERKFLALGYAGWGSGQLEGELEKGTWLQIDADADLVFEPEPSEIWGKALKQLGVDVASLSLETGHA